MTANTATPAKPAAAAQPRSLDSKALNAQALARSASVERAAIDTEQRTVELAFSSEQPYERWFGIEILDHSSASVDMSRLQDGAALLVDHNTRDHVGVVERAWIADDKRGRAIVRFGRSARAEEIWQDVQDGIRRLVSVGYRINEAVLEKRDTKSGTDTYRVTSWTPHEISLVAVPADPTVGVGRAAGERPPVPQQPKEILVDDIETRQAPAAPQAQAPQINLVAERAAAADAERERVRGILALGEQHGMQELARSAVGEGTALDAFRSTVLDKLVEHRKLKPAESAEIGLSARDLARFSVRKLIAAVQFGATDPSLIRDAAFEIEASNAARAKRPVEATDMRRSEREAGFTIPVDVLRAPMGASNDHLAAAQGLQRMLAAQQRDLTVGAPTGGGNLVATDLLSADFFTLLRNRLVLGQLGARVLADLNGNIAIPGQTGGAATFWVTEGNPVSESQATFGQVTMTPKTVGMLTDYTRRLLLQSSLDIEMLVRMDLINGLAVEVDRAGLNGSGAAGQPTGLLNTAGIGAVVGGANGAAPTYEHLVDLESAVANANADVGALGYCTNARVRGKLKKTQMFSGTNGVPVWQGNELNGYRTAVSNNMPNTLTKGTANGICSAIAYGDWSELLIGFWSGVDLILDPYTGATAGTRRVIALQDCDVAVRRAASFAAMVDVLTT